MTVGRSPSSTVWSRDRVRLLHYVATAPPTARQPVLLVPSLINRSYIFDLHAGNSVVETLLAAGLDVYLVDWGEAQAADAENTLETYVDEYLREVVSVVAATADADVTVVGYCLGGILALLYAAGTSGSRVRNLVSLATPIDFAKMGLLVAFVREGRLEVDDVLDEQGNVPGSVIRRLVQVRRPTGSLVTYANLLEHMWRDDYMAGYQAMSQWVRDAVPVPGAFARQVIEKLVRRNEMLTGRVTLGRRTVDLAGLAVPCLVAMAQDDDMVPLAAAAPLAELLRSADVEELQVPGGHIALAVGRRATQVTIPRVIDWIKAHSDSYTTPETVHGDPPRNA